MDREFNPIVSSSPHIKADEDTRSIMLDVIIALLPALALSIYFFGWRSLVVTCVSVGACIFFEWLYRYLMKKPSSIGDLSAAVTGILMAFCMPVTIPYWTVVIGAAFAIVIAKQLYGGIGKNFVNPALAARAFLFSWPTIMTTWTAPMTRVAIFGSSVDAVTTATPMAALHAGVFPKGTDLYQMFLGQVGGSLGETSALLLLLGGIYLLVRKVITPHIPVAYIGTVALLTFLFPRGNDALEWMLYSIFGGGLMLGALFMATDYATSPITKGGQWIYGIGCGLLTVFIRYFGSYPEGVCYAILIMNAFVSLIDKATRPHRFGTGLFGHRKKAGVSK